MKVCFVSHSPSLGGGERSLLETLHVLRERGVDCSALLPRRGALSAELERRGIRCAVLPYRWWVGPEGGPAWRRAARTVWNLGWTIPAYLWIRRRDPDLVYTNTLTVSIGAWAAALARLPHVWHIRELGHEHNRMVFDLGQRVALGMMNRLSALVFANSRCVAERYGPVFGPGRIVVVDQCVTPDRGAALPTRAASDAFRCVVVGAISPAKRQEEAIAAIAQLRRAGRSVELTIVGAGDPRYEKRLREQVRRLDLQDAVTFTGQLDTAWPWIEAADAVLQCSRHEAFGRVTVEGMLAGRPVIGSRSAGTAELVRDGFNGFLYEPGDAEGLAAILARLIDHPEERRLVGRTAREWASGRFGEERFGETVIRHLRRVVESE